MARNLYNRRKFLDTHESRCCWHSGQSIIGHFPINDTLTVSQVIERIIADVPVEN
jgi:hypothetical protein